MSKQQSVSMPMSSAGIIGFSPDVKISGMEVEPKTLVIAIVIIVLLVHTLSFIV
ncbi:MAG: hypothetical protein AB1295_06000 [Candidatus Micrarchaeota archaeon]